MGAVALAGESGPGVEACQRPTGGAPGVDGMTTERSLVLWPRQHGRLSARPWTRTRTGPLPFGLVVIPKPERGVRSPGVPTCLDTG